MRRVLPRNIYRTMSGKYAARYSDFGIRIYIASFDTVEEASRAIRERETTARLLRRRGGSVYEMKPNYFLVRGPSPGRRSLGCYRNRREAEQALAELRSQ